MKRWVYKKICRRCGEYKPVNGQHGRICEDCLIPRWGGKK